MDKDVLHSFLSEYKKELGNKIESKETKEEFENLVLALADKIVPIDGVIAPVCRLVKAIKKQIK